MNIYIYMYVVVNQTKCSAYKGLRIWVWNSIVTNFHPVLQIPTNFNPFVDSPLFSYFVPILQEYFFVKNAFVARACFSIRLSTLVSSIDLWTAGKILMMDLYKFVASDSKPLWSNVSSELKEHYSECHRHGE